MYLVKVLQQIAGREHAKNTGIDGYAMSRAHQCLALPARHIVGRRRGR